MRGFVSVPLCVYVCVSQVPVLALMEMDGIAVDRLKLTVQLPNLEKRCQQLAHMAAKVRWHVL